MDDMRPKKLILVIKPTVSALPSEVLVNMHLQSNAQLVHDFVLRPPGGGWPNIDLVDYWVSI